MMPTLDGVNASTLAKPRTSQVITWAVVVLAGLTLSLTQFNSFQIGAYIDDAEYAVLAQSLARGDTYGLINMPGPAGNSRYPFGYPLILAPIAALFPDNLAALKFPSLFATIFNSTLLFWAWPLFSRYSSYWWGVAVTAAYTLSPMTISQTGMVMSEPIFIGCCLASICLAESARTRPLGIGGCFALALCLFFALFIRTPGLILAALIGSGLLFRHRRIFLREPLTLAAGLMILLIIVLVLTPVDLKDIWPEQYIDQFASPSRWSLLDHGPTFYDRFAAGIKGYFSHDIREAVLSIGGGDREKAFANRLGIPMLPVFIGLLLAGVVILGYIRWYKQRGGSIALVFSLIYLLVLLVWPWRDVRFLYPIQPQLCLCLFLGMSTILLWFVSLCRISKTTWLHVGFMTALVLGILSLNTYKALTLKHSSYHVGDLAQRSSWLRENTSMSAIIMSEQPKIDFLYGHRKTVQLKIYGSSRDLEHYVLKNEITHILLAPLVAWQSAYSPAYSGTVSKIIPHIAGLMKAGKINLVYRDANHLIKIFEVTSEFVNERR